MATDAFTPSMYILYKPEYRHRVAGLGRGNQLFEWSQLSVSPCLSQKSLVMRDCNSTSCLMSLLLRFFYIFLPVLIFRHAIVDPGKGLLPWKRHFQIAYLLEDVPSREI